MLPSGEIQRICRRLIHPSAKKGSSRNLSCYMFSEVRVCYVAMLAAIFAGNMLVNRRVLELDPATILREQFIGLRRRWNRFHAAPNVLNLFGFANALSGVLSEGRNDQAFLSWTARAMLDKAQIKR
jgi:hypothetical protein